MDEEQVWILRTNAKRIEKQQQSLDWTDVAFFLDEV
jgi:hypothetical protein